MPGANIPTIATTQLISRRALEYLKANSNSLKPESAEIVLKLKLKRGGDIRFGTQQVEYGLSRKSAAGKLGYGRLYGYTSAAGAGGKSLEQIENQVRATLCGEFYHDIDIVNCQPVLAIQYAKAKWDRDLPRLADYVKNRDQRLKEVNENRDEAKQAVLRVLYGGRPTDDAPIWLAALHHEMKLFAEAIVASGKHAQLWEVSKSADCRWGSFLSQLLQTEERDCMLAMREFAIAAGWSVDALAYDGIMLRQRIDAKITEDFLVEMAQAVHEKTGYRIAILEKELVGFNMPETNDAQEIAEGVSLEDYKKMRERFEKTHFYFSPTNRICEFNAATGELTQMEKEHARTYLQRDWHFRKGKSAFDTVEFLPIWLRDPERRDVKRIELKPSDDPEVFSTFSGFAYERFAPPTDAAERVALFNELIDALATEPDMRTVLIEWLAHLIQRPLENSLTCMVLAGGKGCGKDTLGDLVAGLLGRYAHNYESTQQFWEKHDQGRMGKLFVKLEEAVGAINRQNEAEFKSRITSATMTVNPKGVAPITMPNCVRYFLTTNDASPIKLDEQERRFVVIPCGGSKIGDMDFWFKIRASLFTPEGFRAIGDWLAAQPYGVFPRVLPKSSLAQGIIDNEKTSEQRFLESDEWDGQKISAHELYAMYRGWCIANNAPPAQNVITFGRRMGQQRLEGRIQTGSTMGKTTYFK